MSKIIILGAVCAFMVALCSCNTCPDHKTRCSDGQTCCPISSGSYGCCPYSQASCCSDGSHCCPHGTSCDIAHGRCVRQPEVTSEGWTMIYKSFTEDEWLAQNLEKEDGNALNATLAVNKMCGGGQQSCPDKYTCCILATGGYGCCPFDNAMCCPDKVHCCPNGKTCNDQGKRCV